MKRIVLALLGSAMASASDLTPQMPMPTDYSKAITARWLAKPTAESRLIDGMEDISTWQLVNRSQGKGEIGLTRERFKEGSSSLRLRAPTTGETPIPTTRYYGTAAAVRVVKDEDWSAFNRLSLWIYPDLPGFRVVSILLVFHNDGAEKVPDAYGKMGMNYVLLRNQEWNRVVWEIANLSRDKVTGVEIRYVAQGNEPGASSIAMFDLDDLRLEKVKADHYEGWNVAPGEFAFSHSGYQIGAVKKAIASDLGAAEFQVVQQGSGKVALSKRVEPVKSHVGSFQVLDFSEVREPGTYVLRAGGRSSRPFPIGDDIWKSSIRKAVNFFYAQRCGFAVPGVHDACHRDWVLKHGDKSLIVNGGWHDAGDLSQSLANTAESAYAMFTLAERIESRGEDPELARAIIDEARWGLDWILKTSFGDGFRPTFSTMDRWTDGILGNTDDMVAQAGNNAAGNFLAAAAEAVGARVLRSRDAAAALHSTKMAEQDFGFAVAGMSTRRGSAAELAAHGILAAAELWRTTGKQTYADKAIEFGRVVVDSQQREFLPVLETPLAGFFYTGPDKNAILRYSHLSHEGEPIEALALLCRSFPNHPDWMKWYTASTLYSEYYQKPMSRFSAPYGMLANSIYKDDEYRTAGGGRGASPESYRTQVQNGVKVGEHHYVRLFPVWFEFRGNHGTMLSETKGIAAAAQLRGNLAMAGLSQQQLEWVVGRNPFAQSTMWGEGYDYAPQYTAMSGDIVGSLPVGIQTHGDADVPYWPAENCHNWKEVWVFPVARWFGLMRDLAGPALVEGQLNAGERTVELREVRSGRTSRAEVNAATSRFRALVPEGEYVVLSGAQRRSLTMLPGGSYSVDLRPGRAVDFTLSRRVAGDGTVTLSAKVEGNGAHTIALRADGVEFANAEKRIDLKSGIPQTVTWTGKSEPSKSPWVAVVYPDGDVSQRKEATGPAQ